LVEAYQCSDLGTVPHTRIKNHGPRFLARPLCRPCVGSYAFVTLTMANNGFKFFFFDPRQAQAHLPLYGLHAMIWLRTTTFSVFGPVALVRTCSHGEGVASTSYPNISMTYVYNGTKKNEIMNLSSRGQDTWQESPAKSARTMKVAKEHLVLEWFRRPVLQVWFRLEAVRVRILS
jgi:hypothetical protein